MSIELIIRILPESGRFEWRLPRSVVIERGGLNDLKASLKLMPSGRFLTTVVVPGEQVFVTSVSINARNRQKLLQAIPYAVEDQLVGEVESYHFAIGQTLADGRLMVAAVELERMSAWAELLQSLELTANKIIPDTLCLPVQDSAASVWVEQDRVLLRSDEVQTCAVAPAELEMMLAFQSISNVRAAGESWPLTASPGVTLDPWPDAPDSLLTLAAESDWMNLAQGEYQVEDQQSGQASKVWRWATVFVAAAVLLATADRYLTYRDFNQQLENNRQRSATLLQQTFPDITRVVDAKVQMEQKLSTMRLARGQQGAGLLGVLGASAPHMVELASIRLNSFNFRQSTLVLDVEAGSVTEIDRLSQRLINAGLTVDLESASATDNGASGRIRIRSEL